MRDPKVVSRGAVLQEELAEEQGAGDACIGSGVDPWSSGTFVPCCAGLQDCVDDWEGTGAWFYKCLASCSGSESQAEPAPLPTPFPKSGLAAAAGESVKLKLLEWNVWYNNKDTMSMAETIKPNSPDIIGLNEFTASKTSLRAHLNERIQGRSYEPQPGWSSFKGYGTYIFYDSNRFDGIEGGVESVHCGGTRGGDRAANWAVLREKTTQGLLITGGIHLSYCSSGCDSVHECELGKTYDKFYAMMSKYPGARVAWMGDLNRGPDSRIVKNIVQGRLGGRQVFPVRDLSRSQHRTYMSGGTIDHIFGDESAFARVSGGNTGQGQPHQRLGGADHFPVYATVQWSPSGDSVPPPLGSSQPSSPSAGGCEAQQVQRRRNAGSCACRRRNGVSSTGLYQCVGNGIVVTG